MIHAIRALIFFLMKTDEKDMETDIKKLARAHAEAAIDVLAEIMTNPDAPAAARISAAKAVLDRGFGKPTIEKTEPESREAPITRIERVIIDPREPDMETPAPIDPPESRPYRGSIRPVYGWPPATKHPRLSQQDQDQDQAQRAPPAAGDYSDYTMNSCEGWG